MHLNEKILKLADALATKRDKGESLNNKQRRILAAVEKKLVK